ncbi:MAG: recombinase family protein, partial [Planctomycetaceae bacterium]|nr:recombinase family protein [Planctomycetaceae bacterium]
MSAPPDSDPAGLVPRSARKRRRARSDRGLPDDAVLAQLATTYLKVQHAAFPALVTSEVLPPVTPEVIAGMVADFQARHRGVPPCPTLATAQVKAVQPAKLGAGYFRYSCDNSKPTSIEDQMVNALHKAGGEQRFIPWCYVNADYSVTGLDASRQGYSSLKAVLADPQHPIDTLYIDDFTRASRDELEWWKLAQSVKKLRKRMIGASDQFDLDNPHWDMQLTIFGLLSRLFIKSLRQKVCRGMRGAISRGGALGKLPLGFTRRAKLDASGHPIVGTGGRPSREICIDPVTAENRLLMYQLFVHENWTLQRIMRHFNQLGIDGWNGWTIGAVRKLLASPTAIGVFRWHMTSREYDPEKERFIVVKNPRKDWVVRYDRELAIVPMDFWRAARRKLAELTRKYGPRNRHRSRNQVAPTTLFSGTLFCACCHEELKLVRSVDIYQQMGSLSGHHRAHECQLTTSKSTRQIEDCLLGYLRDVLLTPENIREIVDLANAALEAEVAKPAPDLAPLVRRGEQIRKAVQRLVRRSAQTDDTGVAASYEAEIKRLRTELAGIEPQIRAAAASQRQRYERLDVEQAVAMLKDLGQILNRDIAVAGPAIRELTGPIKIRQALVAGTRTRYRWIAEFTPQVQALLARVCPTDCGRFAASVLTHVPPTVEVVIDEIP